MKLTCGHPLKALAFRDNGRGYCKECEAWKVAVERAERKEAQLRPKAKMQGGGYA